MRITRKATFTATYNLNNTPLELVDSYKYLGVILSSDLSWNLHVTYVINNANRMLGYLKRNFFLAPSSLKLFLYKTLVRSKLEYAASIWDPGTTYLTDSIESVQNKSARFILANYNRTASVTSMKDILLLPSLAHRRRITSICLFHKIFHHNPVLRNQLFTPPSFLSARLDHQHKVGVPSCRYNKYFNSFIPRVAKEWNQLPSSLASIVDCALFRTSVSNRVFPII